MIPCTYERYGIVYCALCDKAITYCKCGTTPAEDMPPEAGKRIAEVVRKRVKVGGR